MELQLKQYEVLGLNLLYQEKRRIDAALDQALADLGLDPSKNYEITDHLTIREVSVAPDNLPH